jgi:hypothetical protein
MSRPSKFEEFRYVGDKRTQWYFDLDDPDLAPELVAELMDSEQFAAFSPDTPAEARNRGYRAFAGVSAALDKGA